jgi:cytochrome c551/c552
MDKPLAIPMDRKEKIVNLSLRNLRPNAIRYLAATAALSMTGIACAADGMDLAVVSGCFACHRGAENAIGPAFAEVAKRSISQKVAPETLAGHIVKGTGPDGLGWMREGKASLPFMPANSGVKPKDALRLANWILATKGDIPELAHYVTERLTVSGSVEQQLNLGIEELRQFPAKDLREIAVVSQSPAAAGKTENLKGVSLGALLNKAKMLSPGNDMRKISIVVKSGDGHLISFSWCELFNSPIGDGVLVYFEKDGKPLGDDEGRLALMSTKDTHLLGRHVRWLKGVEVRVIAD